MSKDTAGRPSGDGHGARLGRIGCLLLSTACSQDVGGARLGADPRPQAPEVREIALQLEPGHHVTIRRLGNEMVVVTEVGDLGKHEPRIGDRAFLRSVEQIVHLADPVAAVDAGLTAPAAALAPGVPAADRPHTPALLAGARVAPVVPKTSFVPVLQSTSGAGDNVTILRCHDPAVSTCFPQASGTDQVCSRNSCIPADCAPRHCKVGQYWNAQDCLCETGQPQ